MSEALLTIKDVSIYQYDKEILSQINLNINKGELIYIIGKTGVGKSSFIKTLYADLPLKVGEINFMGYDLSNLKEKEIPYLRRKIGIVFQDFQLLPDRNVHDNLLFVLKATNWTDKDEIEAKIDEVLTKVNMQDLASKMPHQLSGGEQQRVAIARALLNDPDFILADEPTGNLDPITSVEIMEVLKNINKQGKSILMATHDYALILKNPSKTLKIEDGSIFEVVQKSV
jgi:cell division transport system ATP-binding protein